MAAGTDWPEVETGLLAHLISVYKTPLHLDAAFDTEDECDALVLCSFPDILDEARLDTVALLMNWKETSGRTLEDAEVHRRGQSVSVAATGHAFSARAVSALDED